MNEVGARKAVMQLPGGRWVLLYHRVPLAPPREAPPTAADTRPSRPSGDHFDLMFESELGLETWAVSRLPDAFEQLAFRLDLHRVAYLDYEGPVSGGRGEVQRVDGGRYRVLPPDEANSLRVETVSTAGRVSIWRLRAWAGVDDPRWWVQRNETRSKDSDAGLRAGDPSE